MTPPTTTTTEEQRAYPMRSAVRARTSSEWPGRRGAATRGNGKSRCDHHTPTEPTPTVDPDPASDTHSRHTNQSLSARRSWSVLQFVVHRQMTVVNFRTDERSERALAELTADGASVSDAIRQALVDAVWLRRREQMRRESLELSNDPADLAASRQVLNEMDELRAW